jgi:ABC-type multidrug transport system ATPase subunit
MKKKLALTCALVHRPDILILDEPTTGVDAVSRREFWDLIDSLRESGLPIVVSTPYMDEASRCDRVALMQQGHILAIDAPGAIGKRFPDRLFAVRGRDRYPMLQALRGYPHSVSTFPFGDELHYSDSRTAADAAAIAGEVRGFLRAKGFVDADVVPIEPGIEDTFMALMGAPEAAAA